MKLTRVLPEDAQLPDHWVILEVFDGARKFFKILSGYPRNYRLSSIIVSSKDNGDSWYIVTESGSTYILSKNSIGYNTETEYCYKELQSKLINSVVKLKSAADESSIEIILRRFT